VKISIYDLLYDSLRALAVAMLTFTVCSTCAPARAQDAGKGGKWRPYVTACLETLVERGTDVYGPVKTPMLMAILDVRTLTSPEHPELNDDEIRTEGRPDHGRRSPGGANLWHDMATLRTMYAISRDSKDPKFAEAADAYINAVFQHAVKTDPAREGIIYWGSHSYHNCFTESAGGDGVHEILIHHPEWAEMYRNNPDATKKEIDQIWEWHVQEKETGRTNRHDSRGTGDFAFSSGSFIIAFAFLYGETKDQDYLDKAILLSDWHWNARDPSTGLVVDSPWASLPAQGGIYWNGEHMFTEVSGCHCSQLLRAYEYSGDTRFRDRAIAMIKAYEKYGWDEEGRNYYGSLRAGDGSPVLKHDPVDRATPASPYMPRGHVDLWRTIMYTWEFPLVAAQASIYAYELSDTGDGEKDAELLAIAEHWGEVVEKNMPPFLGRRFKEVVEKAMPAVKETGGTYAENYGRAISFFVHLYRATDNQKYLKLAEQLAQEAVDKLFVEVELPDDHGDAKTYGIFRGHPAKPYYQSNDFVGILLHALLELDQPDQHYRSAF
jgi:hypothetical protein